MRWRTTVLRRSRSTVQFSRSRPTGTSVLAGSETRTFSFATSTLRGPWRRWAAWDMKRNKQLTAAQLDLTHRLQGHEPLLKKGRGVGYKLHTRLTPINMALDIDYAGLYRRA